MLAPPPASPESAGMSKPALDRLDVVHHIGAVLRGGGSEASGPSPGA